MYKLVDKVPRHNHSDKKIVRILLSDETLMIQSNRSDGYPSIVASEQRDDLFNRIGMLERDNMRLGRMLGVERQRVDRLWRTPDPTRSRLDPVNDNGQQLTGYVTCHVSKWVLLADMVADVAATSAMTWHVGLTTTWHSYLTGCILAQSEFWILRRYEFQHYHMYKLVDKVPRHNHGDKKIVRILLSDETLTIQSNRSDGYPSIVASEQRDDLFNRIGMLEQDNMRLGRMLGVERQRVDRIWR
nr:hypothetical protein [Tanacetum cinerariifolium]